MQALETAFLAFSFTNEELERCRTLSYEQRCYIQTLLADAAAEKLAEEYNALNPLHFAQREAYLRGQMDILNMLLAENGQRPQRYPVVKDQVAQTDVQPQP